MERIYPPHQKNLCPSEAFPPWDKMEQEIKDKLIGVGLFVIIAISLYVAVILMGH